MGLVYSSRMEHPPPVPVTQPRVQNLAHSEGMRFAGWFSSSDWTRWLLFNMRVSPMVERSVLGGPESLIAGQFFYRRGSSTSEVGGEGRVVGVDR